MISLFPVSAVIANKEVVETLTRSSVPQTLPEPKKIMKRLRAVWDDGAAVTDLGVIAGFSGRTSFSGTFASLTIAWPDEKNPRTSGGWQNLLVPGDFDRIRIYLVAHTVSGEKEIPLLTGVPFPGGITESYGAETVEIRIDDVTGVAGRMSDYTKPAIVSTIHADYAADVVLDPIEHATLYPLEPVGGCVGNYPNALMAADAILIGEQDKSNPLVGQKRIRYGDRNGQIVYRLVEDPAPGQPFNPVGIGGEFDFEYSESSMASGLEVGHAELRFSLSRINPYIELGSRLKLNFSRAGISEIVEVTEIGYRVQPRDERMTIKAKRQSTL
ncbi:MAG: hypothetical protein OEY64_08535 [Nitrospinota bacterium]|nr:hypothetical protein [Nitrospinota bacterium]